MWTESYSQVFKNVNKDKIWELWVDVDNWPKFNDDIESAKLDGRFNVGEFFTLKIKEGPSVKVQIVEMTDGSKFTDCTSFPGAKMYVTHEMVEQPEGLRLNTTVRVTGVLGFLWRKLVAEKVSKKMPKQTEALAKLAKLEPVESPFSAEFEP